METLKSKAYQIPTDTIKEFHQTEAKGSWWEHFDEAISFTHTLNVHIVYEKYCVESLGMEKFVTPSQRISNFL